MDRNSWKHGQGQTVQARLNANYDNEAAALDILQRLLEQGHSQRDIICQALLALDGITLQYDEDSQQLLAMMERLEQKFDEQQQQLVALLLDFKQADPQAFLQLAQTEDPEEEAEIINNIVAGKPRSLRERKSESNADI